MLVFILLAVVFFLERERESCSRMLILSRKLVLRFSRKSNFFPFFPIFSDLFSFYLFFNSLICCRGQKESKRGGDISKQDINRYQQDTNFSKVELKKVIAAFDKVRRGIKEFMFVSNGMSGM